jgi:hypothetical protein
LMAFDRKRIQEWPYKTPILIQEKYGQTDHETALIVDQWCVIGELNQHDYCEPTITLRDKAFDLDTYKILTSFFSHKLSQLRLKPFPLDQLTALQEAV